MEIIDGKAIAQEVKLELREAVLQRKADGKKIPHLAAVLVGTDGASMTYVKNKVKEYFSNDYDDFISQDCIDNFCSENKNYYYGKPTIYYEGFYFRFLIIY
jgi:hypothetical protein